MSVIVNEVRRGFYLDSVALMRLSAELGRLEGVDEAVLMIGTESNRQIMDDAGLLAAPGKGAGPNDLVMAVRASSREHAETALAHAARSLDVGISSSARPEPRARTLAGALSELPECNLVLVSTPGEFAAREARAALRRGLNVMIFSDNVPIEEERALKLEAAERGLLVMGPDCGTAYIAGTPLAFANRVARGSIGIVAASGTGLQEFAVLATRLGHGVHHGIGVGGRDLSDAVGGLGALAAIDLMAEDPTIDRIVLISKPPGAATTPRVFERLATCGKPVTACVFGLAADAVPAPIVAAPTLKAAAEHCCGARLDSLSGDLEALARELASGLERGRHALRGLYSGGTLCTEAQAVLRDRGTATRSNAPLPGVPAAGSPHQVLDLGADEYTVGRPHPMIEPLVRQPALRQAMADPAVAVVLLDVVLGLGAHPSPASAIAETLRDVPGARPVVIGSVCGTARDPQDHATQLRLLEDEGVVVAPCNADASDLAARVIAEVTART